MGESVSVIPMCSKCGANPRVRPETMNPWCRECNTEYSKNYEKNRREMAEKKGFAIGVESMRQLLMREFGSMGRATITGTEAAAFVAGRLARP